jgi:hypothetical protein
LFSRVPDLAHVQVALRPEENVHLQSVRVELTRFR